LPPAFGQGARLGTKVAPGDWLAVIIDQARP
jgi:hypothetical protein